MTHADRFDSIVSEHKDAVYRQLVRMCGNHDDAEDVLSESLLKAYRSLGSLEDESRFRAWLVQIGRRTCGRLKQKESLMPVFELMDSDAAAPSEAENSVLEHELKGCILKALETLPENYRSVYELVDVQELSIAEAAEKLGLSIANTKSRLHRARLAMRQSIDDGLA